MSFLLIQNYKYFLLLLALQLKIILSEKEKCYSIYFCKTCPDLDICEKCVKGYILNEDKSKCILNEKQISASASKSSPIEKSSAKSSIKSSKKSSAKPSIKSPKKSSAQIIKPKPKPSPITPSKNVEQKKPSPSLNAKTSQKSSNDVQKFPPPSFNNPIPNINQYIPKKEDDFYSRITLYWIAILAIALVILLIIYCSKKAWYKVNFCQDDQEEASKIIYIR
jgi:hypothetical protein